MTFAVHNLHVPAIEVDEANSYEVQPDGPRFSPAPLATFPDFEEAEEWRGKRLAEIGAPKQ